MEQDEIYLIDLWRVFAREWRWFVAVLVLAVAAAFAYAQHAARQWEATAWIQVGQIAPAPQGQDPKIESFQRVLVRLQTLQFQNEVLQSAGFAPEAPEARLYRKSLKLDPEPYANLIKLSLRASSPALAGRLATATVSELQAIHQRIAAAPLQLAHDRLDEIQADLQSALADRERLLRAVAPGAAGDAGGKAAEGPALAGVLLASKNEDIQSLQQARNELANRLGANYTFATSLPWPIDVPDRPASPNLALIWGLGILAGLFLGTLAAVARNAVRR